MHRLITVYSVERDETGYVSLDQASGGYPFISSFLDSLDESLSEALFEEITGECVKPVKISQIESILPDLMRRAGQICNEKREAEIIVRLIEVRSNKGLVELETIKSRKVLMSERSDGLKISPSWESEELE